MPRLDGRLWTSSPVGSGKRRGAFHASARGAQYRQHHASIVRRAAKGRCFSRKFAERDGARLGVQRGSEHSSAVVSLGLRRKALVGTLEVIVYAGVLFLLYRIIVRALGIEAMGIWSLVMAIASFLRFADTGVGSGVGRFVALSRSEGDDARALQIIDTALLFNAVLLTALTVLLALPARLLLPYVFDDAQSLATARDLLPLAFGALVAEQLVGRFGGLARGAAPARSQELHRDRVVLPADRRDRSLDRRLRSDCRRGGPNRAADHSACRVLPGGAARHARAWHADRSPAIKSRAARASTLWPQAAGGSILTSMFDPISRFVMSSFGGLAAVGTFELAQRGLMQLRQLVVNPSQQLMPAFAHYSERESRKNLYVKSLAALSVSAAFILGGAALAAPLLAWLWLGEVPAALLGIHREFWRSGGSSMWRRSRLTTCQSAPGASRASRWAACATTVLGPLLAVLLGYELGDLGVVLGTALGLALGGVITMVIASRSNGLPLLGSLRDWSSGLRSVLRRR